MFSPLEKAAQLGAPEQPLAIGRCWPNRDAGCAPKQPMVAVRYWPEHPCGRHASIASPSAAPVSVGPKDLLRLQQAPMCHLSPIRISALSEFCRNPTRGSAASRSRATAMTLGGDTRNATCVYRLSSYRFRRSQLPPGHPLRAEAVPIRTNCQRRIPSSRGVRRT